MSHGPDEFAVAERVVPYKLDRADFNLGAFVNLEDQNHSIAGGDAFVLRSHFRELAAVLSEQFLEYDFGPLDFCGIEWAFHGETDLALFEAVENIRFRDGMNAFVTDAANLRAFLHFKNDDFAIGAVLDTQLYVLEELRVPESLKIAAQGLFIVGIAFAAEDARLESVAADSAVANKFDALDHELRLAVGGLLGSLRLGCRGGVVV